MEFRPIKTFDDLISEEEREKRLKQEERLRFEKKRFAVITSNITKIIKFRRLRLEKRFNSLAGCLNGEWSQIPLLLLNYSRKPLSHVEIRERIKKLNKGGYCPRNYENSLMKFKKAGFVKVEHKEGHRV